MATLAPLAGGAKALGSVGGAALGMDDVGIDVEVAQDLIDKQRGAQTVADPVAMTNLIAGAGTSQVH